MEQLIKEIEEEMKTDDSSISEEEKKELEFLQKFTSSYKYSDPKDIAKIDRKNFILAYLCTVKDKEDFSKLQETVELLEKINDVQDYNKIHKLIDLIFKFSDANLVTELSEIPLLETGDGSIAESINSHQEEYKKFYTNDLIVPLSEIHTILKKCFCNDEQGRAAFFYLLKNYTSEFFNAIFRVMMLINATDDIKAESLITVRGKKFENFLQKKLTTGKVYIALNKINERKEEILRKEKEREKRKHSKEKKMQTIKNKLMQIKTKGTIKVSKDLLKILPDENTKFKLLRHALIHNRDNYIELENELLREKSLSDLEKAFKKYSFKFSSLTEQEQDLLTKYGNLEQITKMLELLSDKQLSFLKNSNFPIAEILILSSPSIISTITRLYIQGNLTEDFIKRNKEIFVDEIKDELKDKVSIKDTKFTDFANNINSLKRRKINIKEISSKSPILLLKNNNELEEQLVITDQYKIPYGKLTSFDFLENKDAVNFIDKYIELGLSNLIISNSNIINEHPERTIKRIIVCKMLGIPFLDNQENKLSHNITDDTFKIGTMPIEDKDLDDFIENSTALYENAEALKILQQEKQNPHNIDEDPLLRFMQDDNTYNINGVLISRNKALRNYQILTDSNIDIPENEILFSSVVHGSILNTEELDTISLSLQSNKYIKEKK